MSVLFCFHAAILCVTLVKGATITKDSSRVFIQEPKDQMIPAGKTIQMTCVMNFLPNYVVWYKNDQLYVTREDFGDKDVFQYSVSLLLTPETEDDNSQYRCQVFYGKGNTEYIMSKPAKLTVLGKSLQNNGTTPLPDTNNVDKSPGFLQQPLDQYAIPGEKIELKCVVNFRPKFVKWYRNNKIYMTQDNFGKGKVYSYSVSLLIKADTKDDNNEYKCEIWYGDGEKEFITSRIITISIKDEGYNLSQFDTSRPVSSVTNGGVKSIADSEPRKINPIKSVEHDSLTTANDNDSLQAIIPPHLVKKEESSAIKNEATDNPTFLEQPPDITIKPGESTEIRCIINFRPLKVIWFQNDRPLLIRNDFGYGKVFKYTVSLFVTPDAMDSGTNYKCQIWYGQGAQESIISRAVMLNVQGGLNMALPDANTNKAYPVKKEEQPNFLEQPEDMTTSNKQSLEMRCAVNFRPKHVVWYLNNKKYSEQNEFDNGTVNKFTVTLIIKTDERSPKREYRCQVWYGDSPEEYIMSRTAVLTFNVPITNSVVSATATTQMSSSTTTILTTKNELPQTSINRLTTEGPMSFLRNVDGEVPQFLSQPPDVITPNGDIVEIQCVVNFRPVKVKWYENDKSILTREDFGLGKISKFSVALRLSPDPEDNGNHYKCQVYFGLGDSDYIMSRATKLVVEDVSEASQTRSPYIPTSQSTISTLESVNQKGRNSQVPIFVQEQSDKSVSRGEKAELNWSVNFIPMKVEWLKDDKLYTYMDEFEDIDYEYVMSYSVLLQLPTATNRQSGVYICKVWYGPGKDDFITSKQTKITII